MSFITKEEPTVMNIKITSKGRELLSMGNLNFKYYSLGDSEIDYDYIERSKKIDDKFNTIKISILRPIDINPSQTSYILKNESSDGFNEIKSIPNNPYAVQNDVDDLGFFNIDNNKISFKRDINHFKQPDLMVNTSTISGGNVLNLIESPNYGSRIEKPKVGDYLLVRWSVSEDTINYEVTETEIPLIYKIEKISDNQIEVDRELPNFSGNASHFNNGVMVMYNTFSFSGDTIHNMTPTDYYDESTLTFLTNSQSPTITYPHWNLSIIHTDDIIGITSNDIRFPNFNTSSMGGFVSYIQPKELFSDENIKKEIDKRNIFEGVWDFSGDKWVDLDYWEESDSKFKDMVVMGRHNKEWGGFFQEIYINSGEKIVFSAWVRKSRDNGRLWMHCSKGTGSVVSGYANGDWSIKINNNEEWERISIVIVGNEGGTIRPRLSLGKTGISADGMWLEICGVTVERGDVPIYWGPNPPKYTNIGVIHYTNNSPSNIYGEGFYKNKAKIELPLIRMADKSTIGLTIKPIGSEKRMAGLNVLYFDVGYVNDKDEEVIVGKMFYDMKIFTIENQELLYALSYKSNRSWTLPNYELDYK